MLLRNCEAAGPERLLLADSVSTSVRLRPDFRRAISPGQCRLSALSANWRCRPSPDIQLGQIYGRSYPLRSFVVPSFPS